MDPVRFDGRVALVTGAGGGLGRSHALLFASRGAKVVVNDLGGSLTGEATSQTPAQKVVEEIRAAGGEAVANYDSVADRSGAQAMVQSALDHFGRLDIVVNNAGILRDRSFAKMTEDDFEAVLNVHLRGAFQVTHAAWPHLKEQGYGRVIMTASAAGLYGNFGQANYSAAKMALVGFGQTLAQEGARAGILVNVIAPVARSRMTETILPPEILARLDPEQVSALVAYLCSEESETTGAIFEVGAGLVYRLAWARSEPVAVAADEAMTPELLAERWPTLLDMGRHELVSGIHEALQSFTKRASES